MTGAVYKTETLAIIQLARFGDLVQTSALVQNLKCEEGFIREITLYVDERNAQIAEMLEGVDRVVPIPLRSLPSSINPSIISTLNDFRSWFNSWYDESEYDSLILLNQGILPSSIGYLIKSQRKTGPFRSNSLPKPHAYLNKALVDRSCNPINLYEIWSAYGPGIFPLPKPALKKTVLGTPFAVNSIEAKLKACKNKNIAINLGAGAAGRTPSKEKLAVLISLIIEDSEWNIILLGTEDDSDSAKFMLDSITTEEKNRVFDFTGKTTVQQLVSLLNNVNLLISADTGTIQLAAAVGTKILGLFFGGANPYETGPYAENAVILAHKDSLDQNESSNDTNPIENLDLEKTRFLIRTMFKNKFDLEEINNGFDPFILYMARSTSLGIEYRSVTEKDNLPFGKARRWLPEIRRKIWGDKSQSFVEETRSESHGSTGNRIKKTDDPQLKMWLSHTL